MFTIQISLFSSTNGGDLFSLLNMTPVCRTVKDWATFAPVVAAVLIVGISYGAEGQAAGLPRWVIAALAVAVLGASSELLFVGTIAAGGTPVLAATAALVVNLRNAVYGVAASRFLRPGRARWLGAHFVNDETVSVATARPSIAAGRHAFWTLGSLILIAWPIGAVVGMFLGVVVDPAIIGLDAVFPSVLLAMLLPSLADPDTRLAVGVGTGVAVAAVALVPAGLAPLLALIAVVLPSLRRALRR